ncbi:MAG TPA: peptidoglycan-associated lipoprotein Pal [Candidatus Acidoferrales bacterium]|nr:peptidoglycan-associated lipoprotein Pal [Candidatus Acidoferrales bacterium]
MIPVQHGRGGWKISRAAIVSATVVVVSLGAMLVVVGCSSKKTTGVNGENTADASKLGSSDVNGTGNSLEDWQKGRLSQGPLSDIHFGYNESTIQEQDGSVLRTNASWLQAHADTRVQVEGHCDERGSEEYNMALGAKRAQAAKDYLVTLGISGGRISTISYGKELPMCTEHDESCWAQNRRDHFVVSK